MTMTDTSHAGKAQTMADDRTSDREFKDILAVAAANIRQPDSARPLLDAMRLRAIREKIRVERGVWYGDAEWIIVELDRLSTENADLREENARLRGIEERANRVMTVGRERSGQAFYDGVLVAADFIVNQADDYGEFSGEESV